MISLAKRMHPHLCFPHTCACVQGQHLNAANAEHLAVGCGHIRHLILEHVSITDAAPFERLVPLQSLTTLELDEVTLTIAAASGLAGLAQTAHLQELTMRVRLAPALLLRIAMPCVCLCVCMFCRTMPHSTSSEMQLFWMYLCSCCGKVLPTYMTTGLV
jgi:hypothetical protein